MLNPPNRRFTRPLYDTNIPLMPAPIVANARFSEARYQKALAAFQRNPRSAMRHGYLPFRRQLRDFTSKALGILYVIKDVAMVNYVMATTSSGTKQATSSTRKTRVTGRHARERVRVTVYLDEPLANWGKQQEGGLSELLRRLLVDARQEQSQVSGHYPQELMTPYKRLIDKKLAQGLTATEEQELAQVCESINTYDRASPAWQRAEKTAAAIDQEFAQLRSFIEDTGRRPLPLGGGGMRTYLPKASD